MESENKESGENKQYKDSVFVDLFCDDIYGKENFLSLYNALHNTNFKIGEIEIEPMKLEKVLYHKFYNDVSMRIGNQIIVLCEHQSTINYNMPLRCLIYVSRLYEKMIDSRKKFAKSLQKIAFPEFYVFYIGDEELENGEKDKKGNAIFVDELELKLSDAFIKETKNNEKNLLEKFNINQNDFQLELKVKVLNINKESILQKLSSCTKLKEYVDFIKIVKSKKMTDESEYLKLAINESIKKNILTEYLKRKATEVENMLFTEYNYAEDIAVQREEARIKTLIENIKNIMESFKVSLEQAISSLKITEEEKEIVLTKI